MQSRRASGAIGGATVGGHADQGDVQLRSTAHHREAHEPREAGEPRHQRRVKRLREAAHRLNSRRIAAVISVTWSSISQPPFTALAPCAVASTPEAGQNPSGTGQRS